MKWKILFEKLRCFFGKYRRQAKGAVSILLAIVISPLLTVTLLLVESVRYQHAYEAAKEVIDGSAFSVLAGYDKYLDERFGLLAVEQKNDVNSVFTEYLDKNMKMLGKNVTVNSVDAIGKLALTDADVFKQQLLEYGELSVATEILLQGIDLDELKEEILDKFETLKNFDKQLEKIKKTADLAQGIVDMVNALLDLNEALNNYNKAKTEYTDAYDKFKETLLDLAEHLETAEESLPEGADSGDVYDDPDVKKDIEAVEKACANYIEKANNLQLFVSKASSAIKKVHSTANKLNKAFEEFNDATTEKSLADKCIIESEEWMQSIVQEVLTVLDKTVDKNYDALIKLDKENLEQQIEALSKFNYKMVTSKWDGDKIKSEYGPKTIVSVKDGMITELGILIENLNEKVDLGTEEKSVMSNFIDLVGTIMDFSGIFDSSLNATVDSAEMINMQIPSFSSELSIGSLTDLVGACKEFSESFSTTGVIQKIVKVVKAVAKLLYAIVEFLGAVIAWVVETVWNIVQYIASGPKEWYNSLLLYGYGAYNMPNRTTVREGETLSGYSYSEIPKLTGGLENKSLTGAFTSLDTIGDQSGSDKCFKGAETEYLIVGSKSELMNQSVTFFDLFLLRLVLNLIPIFTNDEVKQIAAMAGPGSWVVFVAVILGEPLLDAIMLVNDQPEYLFKETLYLSYSGMPTLLKHLNKASGLASSLQKNIEQTITNHNGDPKWKGLFNSSYTDHMLLLLMISVNQSDYIKRLQNLVQLEAKCKYESEYEFRLVNAYSYICSEVKYALNPMFRLDGFNNTGVFDATCKQYCGY